MADFKNYSLADLGVLRGELQGLASDCSTLREASQACLNRLFDEFSKTLVLARMYATVPFAYLPDQEKEIARSAAAEGGCADELTEDTFVVTLAATRGTKPEWNDRASSPDRLAIPLLNPSFLEAIPLTGRALGVIMPDIPWLKKQETLILTASTGKMSYLLMVGDAREELTSAGQKAIPDQSLVKDNSVRTVLALGGRYLNGTCIVMLLFTKEQLTQEQATKFTTLVNTIKSATMKAVMAGQILQASTT